MNRRQKIIVSVTGIFIVLLILVGLTYAYFLTRITGNGNPNSISVTTANLELVYGDGTTALLTSSTPIEPGKFTASKDFTVTNNGNAITDYAVTLEDFSITYANDTVINGQTVSAGSVTKLEYPTDMQMEITCIIESDEASRNGKSCGVTEGMLPTENSILLNNSIEIDDTHKYVLTLTYVDSGLDQSADMNKTIKGKIDIIDPKSTIDLEGTVATYQTGDYVEINSTPVKSEIVDGTYKLIGVEPGSHTLYVKYKDASGNVQTRGSQSLTIKKGDTASVSGNVITFTENSRTSKVNVTSSYGIEASTDYISKNVGTLAVLYNAGENISLKTNSIVEDADIKKSAIEYPFSVTNTGSTHQNITIKLTDINISNELKDVDFRWGLYNADTNNGLSFGIFKYVENGGEELIYTDTIIDAATPNITNNYVLRIWVHNNGTSQTKLLNKNFSAKIEVSGEAIEYTSEECFVFGASTGADYGNIVSFDSSKCPIENQTIVFPKTINGKRVVGIDSTNGNGIFDSLSPKRIILPNTITSIGDSYALNYGGVGSDGYLTLPESLKSFNFSVNYNVINKLFIPDTINNLFIGTLANDKGDKNFKYIVLPGKGTSIGEWFVDGLEELVLMDGFKEIGFTINIADKEIELPKSMTTLVDFRQIGEPPLYGFEKLIYRGTSAPASFPEDWNCIKSGYDENGNNICTKYAEVEYRP